MATMPAAKGLVHKGVALSGNSIKAADKENAEALGEFILREAGLTPSEIDKLQEMPWEEYYDLANAAAAKFNRERGGNSNVGFVPVGDGIDIPAGTFFDPEDSSIPNIPMLYCTVKQERNPNREKPELEDVSLEDVIAQMTQTYGENAKAVVEAYAATFPECRPIEIWALLTGVRTNVVRAANTKYRQGSPVYVAWFGWQPPLFDGRLRSFHCLDICFWLHNTDIMMTHTGGGARPRTLSDKMSNSLISFMRTGNPNCKSLPQWPAYTPENGEVMVIDDESCVMNDPDRPARQVIESLSK